MRTRCSITLVTLLALQIVDNRATAQIPCGYTIEATIQVPACGLFGPAGTTPTGINRRGDVCGHHHRCDEEDAFVWTAEDGIYTLPRPPGVVRSKAEDINDHRLVCGTYIRSGSGGDRGFIFDYNTRRYVAELEPLPGGAWCQLSAMNNAGAVCGTRSIGSPGDPVNPRTAFVWSSRTGYVDLGVMKGPNSCASDITDDGVVVGWTGTVSSVSEGNHAFVRHSNSEIAILPFVPGGLSSAALVAGSATAVALVGRMPSSELPISGWHFNGDAMVDLGVLPGFIRTFPMALIEGHTVVGYCVAADPNVAAPFVWHHEVMRSLEEMVQGNESIILRSAIAATVDGHVLVHGRALAGGSAAALLQPIPRRRGDTNCDDHIDISDLLGVLRDWGSCVECSTDFTGDERVDGEDLAIVLDAWDTVARTRRWCPRFDSRLGQEM
jgi:uncharacterized membrane protein